jgi:hypothetical protein
MVPNIHPFRDDMAIGPWNRNLEILNRFENKRVPVIFAGSQYLARFASVAKNLPGLKRNLVADGAIYVDDLIHNSDLAYHSPEGRKMMVKAWRTILNGLRGDDNLHIGFTTFVQDQLKQYWHEDCSRAMFAASSPWPRTKLLFECLAEISHHCCSTTIGNILFSFWQRYGDRIATEDPYLDEWALAILRSSMNKSQKIICIQQIVRITPDLTGGPWFEADDSFASDVRRFIMRLRGLSRHPHHHDYSSNNRFRPPYSRNASFSGPPVPLIDEYGPGLGRRLLPPADGYDSDSDYGFRPRLLGPAGPATIPRTLDTVVRAHEFELEEKDRRLENMEYNLDMLNAKVDSLADNVGAYNYLR